MNVTAVILMVICGCLLAVAYTLNTVRRTNDVRTVLLELTKTRPDTRAVSLGYDKVRRKFRNAVLDQRGNAVIRHDPYPVTETGEFIVLREHGRVDYRDDDGYTIDGFPFTKFACPDGFVGKNCDPVPLCGENDENVYRPLTYRQFAQLRLYDTSVGGDSIDGGRRRSRRRVNDDRHDRIKIHCTSGGRYKLEACRDNELLDENLRCRPYDLCEDRLSGFKHNYPITDNDKLESYEYYTCTENRSVRTKCSTNDMVFNRVYGTCIVNNRCTGMGDATIKIDDDRYIQCRNDTGTTVTCSNGIREEATGRLSCVTKLCRPYDLTYEDDVFRYLYGRVTCEQDRPIKRICEVEPFTEKTFRYKWVESFQFTVKNIPSNVYANGSCKPLTNFRDIVHNSVVPLAWSKAMSQPYPYDFVKEEYVCDTKYRWDYAKGVTVPPTPSGEFVDSGAPCQDRSYTPFELPWQNYDTVRYPETGAPMLIGTPTGYAHETDTDTFWPVHLENDRYQTTTIDVQNDARRIVLTDWVDTVPPLGFGKSTVESPQRNAHGKERLDLYGFGQPPTGLSGHYQWFVIASGRFEPIKVSKSAVKRTERVFEYDGQPIPISELKQGKQYSFPVFWEKLDPNGTSFRVATETQMSRTEGVVFLGATPKRPGLFPFNVQFIEKKFDYFYIKFEYRTQERLLYDFPESKLTLP